MKDFINPINMQSCLTEENQIIYNTFERVYQEYIDETIKLKKLSNFVNSKKFNDIEESQKPLLSMQYYKLRDFAKY